MVPSEGLVWCQLATEPPSVGRYNEDKRAGKHVNLERKIGCLLPFGILPVIELVFILWLVYSSTRQYNHLTHLYFHKLVVASSLV